ncbi:MAG TPA: amidohydrolase family protein [Pirellulaceae bacterium]|nr:amidohydrolase family protein [Pirellulaceae bacterium]
MEMINCRTPSTRAIRRSPRIARDNGWWCALGFVWFALAALCHPPSVEAQVAVRGGTIYTMAGEPIRDGVVVIHNGKIAAVGPAAQVVIPPGYRVLEAAIVTPGLIDAHGTAGLTGIYNQPHDQDQLERSGAMQPELRAMDAVNIREQLIDYLRSFGITTIHTGHAPGELVSGQTMIIKTVGNSVEDAVVIEQAAVAATLGPGGTRSTGSPGTRGKQIAMLRQELIKAQEYQQKRNPTVAEGGDGQAGDKGSSGRDLRMEAMVEVLEGRLPLLVTANKAQDIASALRLAEEFKIRLWLDGAAESYLMIDQIRAARVPVILHPTMTRAVGEYENLSFETAAKLVQAGIPVAMQSGFEGYVPKTRVVLFEAALTAAHGLSFEQALSSITRDAAVMLGVSDRVGSIEIGKDGDLALFDGDPFEYTSHCLGTIIDGRVVSELKR